MARCLRGVFGRLWPYGSLFESDRPFLSTCCTWLGAVGGAVPARRAAQEEQPPAPRGWGRGQRAWAFRSPHPQKAVRALARGLEAQASSCRGHGSAPHTEGPEGAEGAAGAFAARDMAGPATVPAGLPAPLPPPFCSSCSLHRSFPSPSLASSLPSQFTSPDSSSPPPPHSAPPFPLPPLHPQSFLFWISFSVGRSSPTPSPPVGHLFLRALLLLPLLQSACLF